MGVIRTEMARINPGHHNTSLSYNGFIFGTTEHAGYQWIAEIIRWLVLYYFIYY